MWETLSQKIAELKVKTANYPPNSEEEKVRKRREKEKKSIYDEESKVMANKSAKIDCPQMKLEALKEKVAAGEIDNSRDYGGEYDRSMQRKKELKKRRPSFEIIPKGEYAPGKKY